MTQEIDSAAFEAGVAPCNFTAGRIDSADESDAAHFSDALGRIYITAQALLLSARPQAGHTQPALTLVVEDSADGSSWATVASFDFTASDQQSAAVDSPRAYLRASWTGVAGTWAVDVAVKSITAPASGGGSMPAGSDGEIQFNDGGSALGASPSLAWDDAAGLTVSSTLNLSTVPNGAGEIACQGAGVELRISAADGDDAHVGGELTIKSGDSDGNDGGDLTIVAGSDTADGTGGNVTIKSGGSAEGDGGEIAIYANQGVTVPGSGGQVLVHAGTGVTHGGSVIVQGGASDGNVQLYSGDSNQYVQLDNDGLQIGATKLGFFQGAAVAQPGIPVTLDDVIAALQALGLVAS